METIKNDMASLGGALREQRIALGDRQSDFAVRIGVSISTLRAMEAGEPGVSIGNWMKAFGFLGKIQAIQSAFSIQGERDLFKKRALLNKSMEKPKQRVRKPKVFGLHKRAV